MIESSLAMARIDLVAGHANEMVALHGALLMSIGKCPGCRIKDLEEVLTSESDNWPNEAQMAPPGLAESDDIWRGYTEHCGRERDRASHMLRVVNKFLGFGPH